MAELAHMVAAVIRVTSPARRWEIMTAVAFLAASSDRAIETEVPGRHRAPCSEIDSVLSRLDGCRELSDPERWVGSSLSDGGEVSRLETLGRWVRELRGVRGCATAPAFDLDGAAQSAIAAARLALSSLVMGPVFENYETPAADLDVVCLR